MIDEVRCQLGHDLRNTKPRQGEKLAGKTRIIRTPVEPKFNKES